MADASPLGSDGDILRELKIGERKWDDDGALRTMAATLVYAVTRMRRGHKSATVWLGSRAATVWCLHMGREHTQILARIGWASHAEALLRDDSEVELVPAERALLTEGIRRMRAMEPAFRKEVSDG
jgi:hypothetical protein